MLYDSFVCPLTLLCKVLFTSSLEELAAKLPSSERLGGIFLSRDEIEQREGEFAALGRYPIGDRGLDVPNYAKSGYVKMAQWFGNSVKNEIWDKLQALKAEQVSKPEDYMALLKTGIEMMQTKLPDRLEWYGSGDDGYSVRDTYVINEAVVPVLLEIERILPETSNNREILLSLATSCGANFELDYEELNPLAGEILTTIIVAGKAESVPYVIDIFKGINAGWRESADDHDASLLLEDSEQGEWSSDYYKDYSATGLGYMDSHMRSLHMYLCRTCCGLELRDEQDKSELARMLSETLSIESSGSLGSYVEAFDKLGSSIGYPYLLQNLISEDVLTRRMSAEILYRLEIGKIGITSKEGVSYFDKVYKLAKENDPDFFVRLYRDGDAYVQRVDSHGSIGVFNNNNHLLGFFKLDLEAEENTIDAIVHEITSKDVFLPKADEKPDERKARESFLELFLAGYGQLFEQLNEETGIKLNSLELYEQGWFIVYYAQASETQKEQLKEFVKKYGEFGLKVFLALDYGEAGEAILQYTGSSYSSEKQQHEVLLQFYKVANRAFEWRKVFENVEMGLEYKFSSEIHEALLRKCSEYFRAALLIERGEGGEVTIKDLLESMNSVSYALDVLKGLYDKDSALILEGKPQVQAEYADESGKDLITDARTTWTILDRKTGSRVVISVRPQQTVAVGNRPGGEARINFKVTNKTNGIETRIGVDLSDYGEYTGIPGKAPVVSLDLGTGLPDRRAEIYPSQRVGRVLGLVVGSEGGHNEASFSSEAARHFESIAHKFVDFMENKFEIPTGTIENEG